jgi:peptide/nickel transport system permease protein
LLSARSVSPFLWQFHWARLPLGAWAKGIRESAVLLRYALANAAVPVATMVGMVVALLIGGVVVVVVVNETVYAIPSLGSLTVDAVLNRDFPVIYRLVLLFSMGYVLINLLVDVSYLFLDPRIR